ncbi:uncharacterized protein C8A04DRAFT_26579 [Dichotomopilus funicola]|uniref:Uncharacterized protein n=1 Tax=Dichotomopilus funicola TaxID=1934379 RepID=A0AAN6ZQL4_9PEZI|nr:hypothetical protein C8A04DRAFT_26579 [Dichotomopilus funicola]
MKPTQRYSQETVTGLVPAATEVKGITITSTITAFTDTPEIRTVTFTKTEVITVIDPIQQTQTTTSTVTSFGDRKLARQEATSSGTTIVPSTAQVTPDATVITTITTTVLGRSTETTTVTITVFSTTSIAPNAEETVTVFTTVFLPSASQSASTPSRPIETTSATAISTSSAVDSTSTSDTATSTGSTRTSTPSLTFSTSVRSSSTPSLTTLNPTTPTTIPSPTATNTTEPTVAPFIPLTTGQIVGIIIGLVIALLLLITLAGWLLRRRARAREARDEEEEQQHEQHTEYKIPRRPVPQPVGISAQAVPRAGTTTTTMGIVTPATAPGTKKQIPKTKLKSLAKLFSLKNKKSTSPNNNPNNGSAPSPFVPTGPISATNGYTGPALPEMSEGDVRIVIRSTPRNTRNSRNPSTTEIQRRPVPNPLNQNPPPTQTQTHTPTPTPYRRSRRNTYESINSADSMSSPILPGQQTRQQQQPNNSTTRTPSQQRAWEYRYHPVAEATSTPSPTGTDPKTRLMVESGLIVGGSRNRAASVNRDGNGNGRRGRGNSAEGTTRTSAAQPRAESNVGRSSQRRGASQRESEDQEGQGQGRGGFGRGVRLGRGDGAWWRL